MELEEKLLKVKYSKYSLSCKGLWITGRYEEKQNDDDSHGSGDGDGGDGGYRDDDANNSGGSGDGIAYW